MKKQSTFTNIIRKYELLTIAKYRHNRKVNPQQEYNLIMELSQAIALSVLNKCIDPQRKDKQQEIHSIDSNCNIVYKTSNSGQSKALRQLKQSVRADVEKVKLLNDILNQKDIYIHTFNENGDSVRKIADKPTEDRLTELAKQTLGDGIDLVNDVVTFILTECNKARQEHRLIYHWLENTYILRQLKRKVYIKDEDSVGAWENINTTPIQEIYRGLRRVIMSNKALENNSKYCYIEDLSIDSKDGNNTDTIYHRLPKYADLGGYECDINGKRDYTSNYTVSRQDVQDVNDIIGRLNLSDRQAEILSLRQQGYGIRAISTYLGVREQTVLVHLQRIQEKCTKIGFTPDTK